MFSECHPISPQDKEVMVRLDSTTIKSENGHYIVDMLWKDSSVQLPDNRLLAENRFHSLVRRFKRQPELHKKYSETIESYVQRGYARKMSEDEKEAPVTKRGILQVVSPIFDPLGFLAPYNIKAQILLQRLWRMQYGWDDEIVEESKRIWNSWLDELKSISSFALPRRYTNGEEHIVNNQLEIFFDSSEQAFGAVAYPSCIHQTGTRTCSFVMAKTHLAPLKALTIVRLELQAATLAVRLYNTIKNEMDIKVSTVRFWTDSKITLQYIRNQIKRLKTFVTNRVAEIHENSDPRCWFHIDGKENPADDCTRGLHFKGLRWQPMALRFRILTQRGRKCQFEGKSN
eukprot:Seg6027.2 transcript_id=Seg6027.2/GoldUCD/mRNA.D3Y31 product="hypothetical protein" protein_id=Seg6027.2/GoldUCD/D3Y31